MKRDENQNVEYKKSWQTSTSNEFAATRTPRAALCTSAKCYNVPVKREEIVVTSEELGKIIARVGTIVVGVDEHAWIRRQYGII